MSLPPITWLASPFQNARDSRYPIWAEVKHRIVGTLPSARAAFGVAPGTSRNASTHFGIGYVNGKLTVDQYVDLSDMAWGNGDVRDPSWSRIIPGVNPNLYTVSTEHEDGGSANRGRVSEAVWQASMELSKLLRSGDVAKIRAAGIRVRDPRHVAQLAAMPIDTGSYIDHHQIAGPNKPYCFRRWLDDPGFVEGSPSRRDRLFAHLREDDMTFDWVANIKHLPGGPLFITFRAGTSFRVKPDLTAESKPRVFDRTYTRLVIGTVEGVDVAGKGRTWAVLQTSGGPLNVAHEQDVVETRPLCPSTSGGTTGTDLQKAADAERERIAQAEADRIRST